MKHLPVPIFVLAWLAVPAAAASSFEATGATDDAAGRMTLVEAPAFDLRTAGDDDRDNQRLRGNPVWREDQGDLRLRVKLRPNRAMGRMSLSF